MNFVSLMNSKRFHPTNAQMIELEETTKKILGVKNVSVFLLVDVMETIGKAKVKHNGVTYTAARLQSNGRWYLTGDYAY